MMPRYVALAALVGIILTGFALRLHRLDAVPLRGDEAFTVMNWARQPLAATLENIATADPHPPLAYALFRGWGLAAGTTPFVMRVLPALLNVLGIPALYALGKRIGGRRTGLLAAFLWALHPFQIWHAQDARNYAIWSSFSAVGLWLGLRAVDKDHLVDWALYLAAAALAAYVYYLEVFVLAALNLYVFATRRHDARRVRRWIIAQLIFGLILAPWYLQERLLFDNGYGGTTGSFDAAGWFTWFLPTLNFGATLPGGFTRLLWPPLLIALLAGLRVLWRRQRRNAAFLAAVGVVPLLLLGLTASRLNVFTPRYVLAAAPAYTLLFATLIVHSHRALRQAALRRYAPIALAGGWLLIALFSLNNYYHAAAYAKAPRWDLLTAYLAERAAPGDLIIQTAADEAFVFYADAAGVPAENIRLPANPGQPADEIITILEAARSRHDSLWLVAQTFPDWPNAGMVEAWAAGNMQRVRSTSAANLRIEQYMRWQVAEDEAEIESAPRATFGAVAELVGIRTFPPEPTGELTVWLYWRPTGSSAAPLKVFAHLQGANNPATGTPLWAQDDHFPQHGRVNTTTWAPGTVYRDIYTLPLAGVPAGVYELRVGLYDPESGARVPTADGGDAYRLPGIALP